MHFSDIYLNEKLSTHQKLEELLVCPALKNAFSQIRVQNRVSAIGVIIGYHYLFLDGFGLSVLLESLTGRSVGRLSDYDELILRNISEKHPTYNNEDILAYIQDKLINDGYVFHGFNGLFEKDIRSSSLNATSRVWDIVEIDRIKDILIQVLPTSGKLLLGFNSHQSFYVTEDPSVVYSYAIRSPEWFSQFIYNSSLINEGASTDVFERRDYESAKNSIEAMCKDLSKDMARTSRLGKRNRALTNDESIEIIAFFEKYWSILASEKFALKLAVIKRSNLQLEQNIINESLLVLRNNIALKNEIIAPIIISLPSYNEVMSW